MALADVDKDGDLDLLTAHATQSGTVSVQLNNDQGSFASAGSLPVGTYPNPVARTTTVGFATAQAGLVQLRVYNALGQVVATPYEGPLAAGQLLERPLDAAHLAVGVYTRRLSRTGPVRSLKLVVSP